MTMSNYEELLKSKSRYKSFSFDHLSSLVQDLFVAGTETISVTLNWAIIYAAYFFDCQVKLCNEIDSILGREKLPTESDRTKLPYVEAFLNETMRFHCAGPILIPRSTTCDLNFRGYEIPKDTFIMVNMWSAMRDEVYWEDPEKFDPKRFIDEKGQFVCKNPAMMPFSVGKRSCIGESIARLQLFLIFTSLLQKFNFYIQSEKEFREKKLILGKPGLGLNPPNVSLKLKLR
jgi:cytochrome P450